MYADDDEQPDELDIYEENWDTVQMFLRLQTQWQRDAMGKLDSMRYEVAIKLMPIYGIKRRARAAMLDQLRVMEAAALEAIEDGEHGDQS